MRNAGLEETQAGIKIARRNINNLRYADDTTLMAESEELNSLLMKVKVETEKVGLKLNIDKTKIMASSPTTSWQIDGETVETETDFIYLFIALAPPSLAARPCWGHSPVAGCLAGRGSTTARGILRLCPASACQTGLPWSSPPA